MGGKKNGVGCFPFCGTKQTNVHSPDTNPRTSTGEPVTAEAQLQKTENEVNRAITKAKRGEDAMLGRSVGPEDITLTLQQEYAALEIEKDLEMKEKVQQFAEKLYENVKDRKMEKINEFIEAFNYLVDASKDRKEYIKKLKAKSDPTSIQTLNKLQHNAYNYSRMAYDLQGIPVTFIITENDIKEGIYNEFKWNSKMMILKSLNKRCFNNEHTKHLKSLSQRIPLLHEYRIIFTYIDERDVLSRSRVTQKGGAAGCIKQFRKVLKKTHITTIPKTHLLKKSDLKKAKVYVVKSPSYDKVTLLKPKDTLEPTVMKWIRVDAKSLKWLQNKK